MTRSISLLALFFFLATSVQSREPKESWSRQRGITEGTLIEGSQSPSRKYALFEFHIWDGQTPDSATTATGVGLAPIDRSKLLFIIDSRTEWMTDKKVTSFLSFLWNKDSTLLATHDSGAKHSRLSIYRIPDAGSASSLEIPDLIQIAAKKLGIDAATVKASGQIPVRWIHADTLEVSIRLTTSKSKVTAKIPLHIDAQGNVSTQ